MRGVLDVRRVIYGAWFACIAIQVAAWFKVPLPAELVYLTFLGVAAPILTRGRLPSRFGI